jgi:hypothetical protein
VSLNLILPPDEIAAIKAPHPSLNAKSFQANGQKTSYSNYVHAFLTPPGNQGLRHHWDQQMAADLPAARDHGGQVRDDLARVMHRPRRPPLGKAA